ncbi:hypothetical protein YC2023_065770 [Brassica napus]
MIVAFRHYSDWCSESVGHHLQTIFTPKNCYIALGPLLCTVVCLSVRLGGDGASAKRYPAGGDLRSSVSMVKKDGLLPFLQNHVVLVSVILQSMNSSTIPLAIIKGMSYLHQRPRLISLIS